MQPWPLLLIISSVLMKQHIRLERGSSREDEAIPVQPVGVLGVVAHLIPPEGDADGSGAHDGTGVTTLELNAS